jgi:predicted PurR-regulated permease PerM
MPSDLTDSQSATDKKSSVATGIIAFGIVMAICYVAGSVIETVIVSILLAIFLDPLVGLLARIRIPRALGALIAIVLLGAVVGLASVLLYNRVQDFAQELPRYSSIIRQNVINFRRRMDLLQKQTEQVIPRAPTRTQTVTVSDPSLVTQYLFPGVQTAASALLLIGFIPFLVYFMLSWKDHLRDAAVEAFRETDRADIVNGLHCVAIAMRRYLAGNILVGLILSVASCILFLAIGLRYWLILGILSGFLSLIPYLGVVLAAIGPVLITVPQNHTLGEYFILVGSIVLIHLFGLNFVFPKIVGAQVNMNPLAVTLALMLWGWMWGAMGLILAIPITAAAKAVCDNIGRLRKYGRLLGE